MTAWMSDVLSRLQTSAMGVAGVNPPPPASVLAAPLDAEVAAACGCDAAGSPQLIMATMRAQMLNNLADLLLILHLLARAVAA
jgi:hypothetical protein